MYFKETASAWTTKGGTLSDKSARKEYGLTQDEIIEAMKGGKLQYRINYMRKSGVRSFIIRFFCDRILFMARQLRISGALYHITSRGNAKMSIFAILKSDSKNLAENLIIKDLTPNFPGFVSWLSARKYRLWRLERTGPSGNLL